jgi:aminoglycoside phosphotransferase (APT) family kinase protein
MWPGVEVEEVRPLAGGQWADLAHLRLAGQPDGIPGDVVLRVAPDAAMGAKEMAVQAAVGDLGIATPRVHLTGPAGGPLGGTWSVMDLVLGEPLIADLDGAAALRRLPALLRRMPRQLADTMASIHRIDPRPVAERTRAAAPTVALSVDELWSHLHAAATTLAHDELVGAVEVLHETRPPLRDGVVCHGDLHPFNLLVHDGTVTVLDWTAAIVAPPAYDVAFTWLLLRHPPLLAPGPLRPAIRTGAAVLARRFVRSYRRAVPTADLTDLGWYAGLHSARVLLDLAGWRLAGDVRAERHPWRLVAPGAVTALHRASGVHVDLAITGAARP